MIKNKFLRNNLTTKILDNNIPEYYSKYIELRSDVKTVPTMKMKQSVLFHNYGDEAKEEDPAVVKLQETISDMFSMNYSLFVPSGTMANMIGLNLLAKRGDAIIQGDRSHQHIIEKENFSHMGLIPVGLKNLDDGSIDLDEEYLKSNLEPYTLDNNTNRNKVRIASLENTHNFCGGMILETDFLSNFKSKLEKIFSKEDFANIRYHLDGSRVLNAAVALGEDPGDLVKGYDSVNVCLSKGIGAPCGSMLLVNTKENYFEARRIRKMMGGNMRQSGFLAAPALVALEDFEERFIQDHINAKNFQRIISENITDNKVFFVRDPQTNIVNVNFHEESKSKIPFIIERLHKDHSVLFSEYPNYMRSVFHHQVSASQTKIAAKAVVEVCNKYI